jgi:formamidopyrimidine-DNA glycosylase
MPELPELTVVREVLERRVSGRRVAAAALVQPGAAIVVRDLSGAGFEAGLTGVTAGAMRRRGKHLILEFATSVNTVLYLIINPKLTGRLQLAAPGEKRMAKTCFVLGLDDGTELRYVDQKLMGQAYLSPLPPERAAIPDFAGLGPEPFDVTFEEFVAILKPFRGEIKGILTRGEAIAGIGNAYADEILWAARIHPYNKKSALSAEEYRRLYDGMRATLADATEKVRAEMGENIHLKPRDFMNVHMRKGEACPRCGRPIAEISANQRITNFCRQCQPGGLIKGM